MCLAKSVVREGKIAGARGREDAIAEALISNNGKEGKVCR